MRTHAPPAAGRPAPAPARGRHGAAARGPVPIHPRAAGVPLVAPNAARAPVVQRSVLHKIVDGDVRYYSDLEKGSRDYDTKEEAQAVDDGLAADSEVVASALTTGQKRSRRVPTPYGHLNSSVAGRARHQEQGPHSLSFISFEQRLQNRLRKGQHLELADQVLTPEQADALFSKEYGTDATDERHKRYLLDYRSLHDEFNRRLRSDKDVGINSPFHLVARKLLQLNPYTTYRGPKSTSLGEDRHAVVGTKSIDDKAYGKFTDKSGYETYLQTRGDLYHSSDEEEEGYKPASGGTPYSFLNIVSRPRKYARKKVVKAEEGEKKEEAIETEKRDTGTREIDPDAEGSKKKVKIDLEEQL